MAIVRRSASANDPAPEAQAKGRPAVRQPTNKVEVELPTQLSEVSDDIRDYILLVHGDMKIGKTALFAQEPDSLFLEFDPAQQAKKLLQVQVPDWRHFLAYLEKLEGVSKAGGKSFPYRNIVVDRLDLMYVACFKYACEQMGIQHPQDADYGKGWDRVKMEFSAAVHRVMHLPAPSRWICHSAWKEITARGTKQKVDRLIPELAKQANTMFTGLVDVAIAYTWDESRRVMIVQGSEEIAAGHRCDGHFQTPKGRAVVEIPGGESAGEAYQNLLNAFNNKQFYTTLAEYDAFLEKKAAKEKKGGEAA